MPPISELIARNQRLQASGKAVPAEPESVSSHPQAPLPPVNQTGLPVRGVFNPDQILHTDFSHQTDFLRNGPNSRSATFPPQRQTTVVQQQVTKTSVPSASFAESPANTSSTVGVQSVGFQGIWRAQVLYLAGDTVDYGGNLYLVIANVSSEAANTPDVDAADYKLISSITFAGAWDSTVAYTQGQIVSVGSALYICIANNTNEDPTTTTGYWQLLTGASVYEGTWSSSTAYSVGQTVSYSGNFYICISANTNQTPNPTGSSYWVLLGTSNALIGNWSNAVTYTKGNEVVGSDGNIYQSLQSSNINHDPTASPTYWQLMGPDNLDAVADGSVYGRTKSDGLHTGYVFRTSYLSTLYDIKGVGSSQTLGLDTEIADGTDYIRGAATTGQALAVQNPMFTNGTAGWFSGSGTTIAQDTTSPYTNGKSLKITTAGQYYAAQQTASFKCTGGDKIYFAAYLKSDGIFQIYGQLAVFDGGGSVLGYYAIGSMTSTSWTAYSNTFTMPANAAYFIVQFARGDATGGSQSGWVTDVQLTRNANMDNEVIDGSSRFAGTSSNISYRPDSDPLTSVDAGSNATINVASFNLVIRTQNITSNVAYNSGSITGLSYGTLYYVYCNDATFAGGSVTYLATSSKSTILTGSGYVYIGSITTAVAGSGTIQGNNDGGSAQNGNTITVFGSSTTVTGSFSNPNNAIDGNPSTSASSGSASASLVIQGFSSAVLPGCTGIVINVDCSTGGASGKFTTLSYSTDGGASYSVFQSINGTAARTTYSVTLGVTHNPALIRVKIALDAAWTTGADNIYQAYISETY